MDMQTVNSSAINAMGFDPETGTMQVEFSSGETWEYNTDQGTYNSIVYANSIGKAFHAAKGRLQGRKVNG